MELNAAIGCGAVDCLSLLCHNFDYYFAHFDLGAARKGPALQMVEWKGLGPVSTH